MKIILTVTLFLASAYHHVMQLKTTDCTSPPCSDIDPNTL